ncbi:MAG: alpha-2-macroglobulin [Maricaulaceae bacterium]
MRKSDWPIIGFGVFWFAAFVLLAAMNLLSDRPSPRFAEGEQTEAVEAAPGARAAAERAEAARETPEDDQPIELATRDPDAPRARPIAPDRFEYLRYYMDVSDVQPRACLVFSAPLDPSADYEPYIEVDPQTPIEILISGQSACVGGLTFGESRDIVVREGLPSADGRELARTERTAIDFGDRPAHVGFAGSGVILPRLDADGLALETVNVDAVLVSVKRVSDRALVFKRVTEGNAIGEGDYGWLDFDESADDIGMLVWEGEMAIEGEPNAPTTTVFPLAGALGTLEPGAYFVEVTQKREGENFRGQPASARRWIMFTDLALTSYRSQAGLDVTLRSLQSAQTVRGAELALVARSNEILAIETTGANGRAHFSDALMSGQGALAPRYVMAYGPEGDFAALDLYRAPVDLSGEDIAGRAVREGADVFVYLDRGIYRPGETVRASSLIRDAQARALAPRPGAFAIYRPNGIEAERIRFDADGQSAGARFYDYDVPRDAARGMWRIAVELDGLGQVASESFAVEDFVPQRVALELDADEETAIAAGEIRAIRANARFLYGAPGAGLPIEGEARIEVDPSPFDEYAGYRFGRHDEQFRELRLDLPEGRADGAGDALVPLDLYGEGENASQPLRVIAVVSVEEPGGRAVSESVRIPYRPRDLYVGIDPSFDGNTAPEGQGASFDLVALDGRGEGVSTDVDWRLLRIDWHYDWWRDDYGDWNWRRSREVVEIEAGREAVPAIGTATVEIAGLDWGDYELIASDPATGAESSVGFWSGWGGRATSGVEAPDRVRISAPEEPVVVGARAEFTIVPPYPGEAEIVLATDRVLETRSVTLPTGGGTVSFDVTEDWGAGAYVMASVFTPRDPVSMPRPRRAVGVSHVPVDMGERTFEITLNAPEVVRPRQTIEIEVQTSGASAGEDAFITLAAVDEGILRLTQFASPDPVDWYYGQKYLGVSLYDDYGRLLDPNQGAAAPVNVGGGQLGGEGLTVTPTRTVALFSGPVALEADGSTIVPVELPDFNGELRLMAVAWSPDAVGGVDRPLTVRDEVPAELILPRFLAPGDEAIATATIDNVEGESGTYEIVLASAGLKVPGDPIAVNLAEGERRDLAAAVGAGEEGIDELSFSVEGPDFAVSRDYQIQTRSPYLPARYASQGVMSAGEGYETPSDLLSSFVPGSGEVQVSFSAIPMDAGALYASLDQYPYGCTEQVTSRAMPLLYAGEMAALADIAGSERAAFVIQNAVSTILNRQSADGTIGLWRVSDYSASPWLGAYAVDFLSRAKEAGYAVPDAALDRALNTLSRVAEGDMSGGGGYDYYIPSYTWQQDTYDRMRHRARAYALYVLAREGRANVSRLRYVHDQELELIESPLARAHIAAALAFAGDRSRAISAFEAAVDALGYQNRGDYYQTPRRDLAGILALAAEAGETDLVESLAQRVERELPEPSMLTTQEKAFMLLAAHALLDGREGPSVSVAGLDAEPGQSRFTLTEADLERGVSFENAGAAPLWRTVVSRGAPATPPRPATANISVQKTIHTLDGAAARLNRIEQGDRLIVQVLIQPYQRRTQPLIVADLLPAGFEIEAILRPEDAGDRGPYGWLGDIASTKVAEARDDRFVAALDVYEDARTLAYVVRAVTPGRFVAPGVVVEDMYRPDVFARSAGFDVEIAPRS